MMRAKAAGLALAASFSVYAIPIAGPHAAWFLGEMLLRGSSGMSPQWKALNIAVALAAQLLVFACFYWHFRKPGWRRLIPVVLAFPVLFMTLERAYLSTIPALFLEERDVAPENTSWPIVCTAPRMFQTDLHTVSELWVRDSTPENHHAVLTMPGCKIEPVALPKYAVVTNVKPGKRALYRQNETGKPLWSVTPYIDVGPPPGDPGRTWPILSDDGQSVAWAGEAKVVLRPLDSAKKETVIGLSSFGPAIFALTRVDTQAEEITLWKGDRFLTVDFNGKPKADFAPPGIRAQSNTYIAIGTYWLAWDAYREDERYSVAWSLPFGAGSHQARLGRSIHSAATDPSGKWVAVSVGTELNIGSAQDAVYILSAADGHEVFRKYLSRYTRSPIAFLDGGYFAYSDLTGVRVLRVPD